MAEPVIGDFRSVPNNVARTESKVETPPATTPADETIPLTPVELYRKRLTDTGISLSDAQMIYDNVLTKGYHEEIIPLKKGVRAVFRTRAYDDTMRLQQELEAAQPRLVLSQEDLVTRFNLAASLYEWKGEAIKHDGDDAFDAALAIVKKMPGPVFSLLAQALAKFDQKIMVIFSEGSAEAFT